jgi:general secretion pathway protein D
MRCAFRFLFLTLLLGASAAMAAGDWTLKLKDVDIRVFLDEVAALTGEHFAVDPEVKAKVTVIGSAPMNAEAAHEILLSVLRANRLIALAGGAVTRIAPESENGKPPAFALGLITRILPLNDLGGEEAAKLARPLLSASGTFEASEAESALIVSDYPDHVARIAGLFQEMDRFADAEVEVIPLKEGKVSAVVPLLEAVAPAILNDANKAHGRLRIVSDESGEIQVIRLHYADAKETAATIRALLFGEKNPAGNAGSATGGGTSPAGAALPASVSPEAGNAGQGFVQADAGLNALLVRARPSMMHDIRALVAQLDAPRPQVLIEAAIVEITANRAEQLGIQLGGGDPSVGVNGGLSQISSAGASISSILSGLGNSRAASFGGDGLNLIFGKDARFNVLVQALASASGVNLLSTPSIITLDNEEAKIVVGQSVPFRTGSVGTQTAGIANPFTTIERQDIGLTLKVVPQIHDDDLVRLGIEQEVSSIAPSTEQSAQAADLITNKRTISTKVIARDGETIMLGGLIEDDTSSSVSKVPLLGDLPLLGALFRGKSQTSTKTNLIVFLRPTVLRDSEALRRVTNARYRPLHALRVGERTLDDDATETLSDLRARPPADSLFAQPAKRLPWLAEAATAVPDAPAPALPWLGSSTLGSSTPPSVPAYPQAGRW